MKLNLGAGNNPIPGYINVDVNAGVDARHLSSYEFIGPGPYEEIRASHVLEHLSFADAQAALEQWFSLLGPGGELRIAVPDVAIIARMMQDQRAEPWMFYLMGGQTDEHDFHLSCWTEIVLAEALVDTGLERVSRWEPRSDEQDTCRHPVSLRLRGFRPGEKRDE